MELSRRRRRGSAIRFRAFALLLGVLASTRSALSLDPDRRLTQFPHQAWDTRSGLPDDFVAALVQTRDGYLWAGTNRGLARFDGVRFTVVSAVVAGAPALLSKPVHALLEDREGALWIGTDAGLVVRRGAVFSTVTTREGLPHPNVTALCEGEGGSVWIGTQEAGQTGNALTRVKDGVYTSYTAKDGLPGGWIWALLSTADGSLWVGAEGGLGRLQGGRLSTVTTADGLPSTYILSLAAGRDGVVWIGTTGGLGRLSGRQFTNYSTRDGLSHDSVIALREDRAGNLWIGTIGGGLSRLRDGTFDRLTTADGLSSSVVRALVEDTEGNLWIGCSGGLDVLRDPAVTVFTMHEGMPSDLPRAVFEDREGGLWIGTGGGGLARFHGGRFTTYTTTDGLSSNRVLSFCQGRDGKLWIGTSDGLTSFDGLRFQKVAGLEGAVVRAMREDRDGRLWLGTEDGVYRLDVERPGGAVPIQIPGLPRTPHYALLVLRDGTLLAGSAAGVVRLRDGKAQTYLDPSGRPPRAVHALHEDADGTVWIAGESLWRLKDEKLSTVTAERGLPSGDLQLLVDDDQGRLWIGSTRGLFSVRRGELDDAASGRRGAVSFDVYGKAEGMRSAACASGSACRTRDGRLWFPTQFGLAMVDPRKLTSDRRPPPVHVEEVVVDRERFESNGPLVLPPGREKVEIHYTAPSFRAPEKVRFRYRLEGFDRDWVDVGTRRTAFFTNLAPAAYAFRVQGCNSDGVWNEVGASLSVTLEPFFYQTLWFRLLCGLGLAGAVTAGYRLRIRQLKARETELERIVGQRTEELHGTVQELRRAQEQLARLSEATPEKLENVSAWGASMAGEVARAIRAVRIGIFRAESESLVPLSVAGSPARGAPRAPSWEAVTAAQAPSGEVVASAAGETVVPVLGMTGELRGALLIEGPVVWGPVERQLVTGFAQHLGSALDLQHLRERLTVTEARQAAARQRMREQGVAALGVCVRCGRCDDEGAGVCKADGMRLDASRPLPLRVLGRYRLDRLLGEGGMGTVFAAHDEKLRRDVALKVIKAEHVNDPSVRFRLEREARTLAQVRHPGVIALFDSGELDDGSAFLVMELLSGRDLSDLLAACGPGTPSQVAALLRQTGAALAAAHRAGVTHRDIKPANILLVPAGAATFQAKLLDFGLAKTAAGDASMTRSGIVVGTPAYMSPEQVQGLPLDARSDLYSLAAVAYEALTGHRVVDGSQVARIFVDVLHAVPPDASAFVPGLPPGVDEAFRAALDKRPERRPAAIEAWAEGLASLLEAATAERPGWPAAELQTREAERREAGGREKGKSVATLSAPGARRGEGARPR